MKNTRLTHFDLLRCISMFLVVVVHTAGYLVQPIPGFNLASAVSRAAIVCDPIFFMLSGYFALRPLKTGLGEYYLKKFSSIVIPILLYSVVLHLFTSFPHLTVAGYLTYASDLFLGGWWFIPTLIPYLVLASFMFRAFEALDDTWMLRLFKLVAAVYVWGVFYHLLVFLASLTGIAGLAKLAEIASACVPRQLPGGYLPVFLAGYLYRRVSPLLSSQQKTGIIASGAVALLATFVTAGFGFGEDDPNQLWIIAAFSAFFLFERIRIEADSVRRAIEWVARRSYSIYLFQYTTILVAYGFIYDMLFNGVAGMTGIMGQLLLWLLFTAVAYCLALACASVLDPLLLHPVQRVFHRLVAKVPDVARS